MNTIIKTNTNIIDTHFQLFKIYGLTLNTVLKMECLCMYKMFLPHDLAQVNLRLEDPCNRNSLILGVSDILYNFNPRRFLLSQKRKTELKTKNTNHVVSTLTRFQ